MPGHSRPSCINYTEHAFLYSGMIQLYPEEPSASERNNGTEAPLVIPSLFSGVLKKEMHLWKDNILVLIGRKMPCAGDDQIAWRWWKKCQSRPRIILRPIFAGKEAETGGGYPFRPIPGFFGMRER